MADLAVRKMGWYCNIGTQQGGIKYYLFRIEI